jgi:hypothetical protein
MCLAGLVIGILGVAYAVWSDVKRRDQREWIHMALANLKPGIGGPNQKDVLGAINNMMAFLKPPKK